MKQMGPIARFDGDDDYLLTDRLKGFPFGAEAPLGAIGAQGWNLLAGDIPLPAAVLKRRELQWNCEWMAAFATEQGIKLAPHVKTAMAPALMKMQLDAGAWALTVANVHQMRICHRYGAKRILVANQIAGRCELRALVRELVDDPHLDVMVLADSAEAVGQLEEACSAGGLQRRLGVLVELGYIGGRAGCRSIGEAAMLARQVARSQHLELVGLEVYEGLHQSLPAAEGFAAVGTLLTDFEALYESLCAEHLFVRSPPILTAGGSSFYPEVAARLLGLDCDLVLRSGCYIVHDDGLYDRWLQQPLHPRPATGPKAALEVWAHVLSRPEPGLLILNAGKRDLGCDAGLPVPVRYAPAGGSSTLKVTDWRTVALSDQHAHVAIPANADVQVGDRVGIGVSHPCTTLDKWQLVYLVDEVYGVTDALRTYF